MGQKVNPKGFRLGISNTWSSNWYADKRYGDFLIEDIKIRKFIENRIFYQKYYAKVEISDIKIKRFPNIINIYIYTSRPGILIGKKGADIENLKKDLLDKVIDNKKTTINISINEVKQADLNAAVVSQLVGKMIKNRMSYKKAMKQAITKSMKAKASGIKIQVAGRLGGSDMARREYFREGSVPLHTLTAHVDYAKFNAVTTYGIIGVSVWIYQGETNKQDSKLNEENVGSLVTKD